MNEKKPSADRAFHAIGMNETPKAEASRAASLVSDEVVLIVEQLERFAKLDAQIAARGYRHLLVTHQDHPDREAWERRAEELEK